MGEDEGREGHIDSRLIDAHASDQMAVEGGLVGRVYSGKEHVGHAVHREEELVLSRRFFLRSGGDPAEPHAVHRQDGVLSLVESTADDLPVKVVCQCIHSMQLAETDERAYGVPVCQHHPVLRIHMNHGAIVGGCPTMGGVPDHPFSKFWSGDVEATGEEGCATEAPAADEGHKHVIPARQHKTAIIIEFIVIVAREGGGSLYLVIGLPIRGTCTALSLCMSPEGLNFTHSCKHTSTSFLYIMDMDTEEVFLPVLILDVLMTRDKTAAIRKGSTLSNGAITCGDWEVSYAYDEKERTVVLHTSHNGEHKEDLKIDVSDSAEKVDQAAQGKEVKYTIPTNLPAAQVAGMAAAAAAAAARGGILGRHVAAVSHYLNRAFKDQDHQKNSSCPPKVVNEAFTKLQDPERLAALVRTQPLAASVRVKFTMFDAILAGLGLGPTHQNIDRATLTSQQQTPVSMGSPVQGSTDSESEIRLLTIQKFLGKIRGITLPDESPITAYEKWLLQKIIQEGGLTSWKMHPLSGRVLIPVRYEAKGFANFDNRTIGLVFEDALHMCLHPSMMPSFQLTVDHYIFVPDIFVPNPTDKRAYLEIAAGRGSSAVLQQLIPVIKSGKEHAFILPACPVDDPVCQKVRDHARKTDSRGGGYRDKIIDFLSEQNLPPLAFLCCLKKLVGELDSVKEAFKHLELIHVPNIPPIEIEGIPDRLLSVINTFIFRHSGDLELLHADELTNDLMQALKQYPHLVDDSTSKRILLTLSKAFEQGAQTTEALGTMVAAAMYEGKIGYLSRTIFEEAIKQVNKGTNTTLFVTHECMACVLGQLKAFNNHPSTF